MVVLLLTGTLVFQLVTTTTQVSQGVDRFAAQVRSSTDAVRDLPRLVHEVRPPFWADGLTVNEGTNRLRVGYYQGDASRTLEVLVEGDWLVARVDNLRFQWGPFEGLTLKTWRKEGRAIGVELHLRWRSQENTLRWAWGAHPL